MTHSLAAQPFVLWLTGLSGAGKSTIGNLVLQRLDALALHATLLDGDHLRAGLCADLGFGDADRQENIRRAAEVARLMFDAGLIVVATFISPFARDRTAARARLPEGRFLEVFIDAPLSVAEARDPKGLYRRARAGQLPNFTGISSPYEAPASPEVRVDTSSMSADRAADRIIEQLHLAGLLQPRSRSANTP